MDAATKHALTRLTYGWKPALAREVRQAGGFQRWFDRQVSGGYSDAFYTNSARWWTSVNATPAQIRDRNDRGVETMWQADANYQRWVLVRRVHSRRQVLETVTEVFEHHLHVPARGEASSLFRADYGKTIRRHALGKFSDLLVAAVTHPAMGLHLDNATSTKKAPNENLGRELLELFTVGVGHHTETDVKNSARILTGYRVDQWRTWRVWYEPADHWTGPVKVLGFSDRNAKKDGRAVAERYLRYLARHPRTARTVARKLAVRLVSDEPSHRLVEKLAKVYLANDTAIVPVLRALVADPEFRGSVGRKVRTPSDDVVATYRALRVTIRRPTRDDSAANAILWQCNDLGTYPFGWPRPDGMPDRAEAWASTSRWLASLRMHQNLAGGWWPKVDARHRPYVAWIPKKRRRKGIRFARLVRRMSRQLHGRPPTKQMITAACQATGCKRRTRITRNHPLARWQMPQLLAVLLDSPRHMTR